MADAVHAVVPVAAAHERQPVRARRARPRLERAQAVLVDADGASRVSGRLQVGVLLLRAAAAGPSMNGVRSSSTDGVAGRREVLGDDVAAASGGRR